MMLKKISNLTITLAAAVLLPLPYAAQAQDPLTVANVRASAVDDQSATIQWSTNYAARGKVEYGKSASYGQSYGFEGEPRISQSITLPNLTADTVYHFRVIANTSFEEARSFDQTFTTHKAVDRDTPVVTDVAIPYQLSNLVVIQWRTNEPADSQVLFGPNTRYGRQAGDSALVTVHDITITGLQPLTTYHFQVKSKDNGNNTGLSTDYTFRTASDSSTRSSLELLNVRPVAANDPAITDTTAEISWRTNTLADGLVRWGTTDGLGLTVQSPPPRDFFHTAKLVNLQPATTYYFQVESKDVFGVSVRSPIFTFITKGGYRTPLPSTGRVAGISASYDLMFYNSFDRGLNADFALGSPTASAIGNAALTAHGVRRGAIALPGTAIVQYAGSGSTNAEAGTITFWFKPNWNGDDGVSRIIFLNDINSQGPEEKYFVIGKTGSHETAEDFKIEPNKLYFGLEDTADKDYRYFVQNAALRAGQWVFLAVSWSYNGGIGRVYLNGQQSVTTQYLSGTKQDATLQNVPTNFFTAFMLGSDPQPIFGSQDGDITIDELAIFGRVLSDDEIKLLYAEGVGRWLPRAAAPTSTPTARVLGASTLQYTSATALLKAAGEPDVYAIMNGQKHLISGPSSFAAYGYRQSDVRTVPAKVLEKIPHARLVRTPDGDGIYYLYQRPQNLWLKLLVPSPTVFISYPENFWGNVITINEIDFTSYPEVRLIKTPDDPTVYLLEGVIKRRIDSDAVFDRLQLPRSHVAEVNLVHLNFYPVGEVAR